MFAFNGCGDVSSEKGGAELQSKVITENDLFANPQIKATYQHTIVIQLWRMFYELSQIIGEKVKKRWDGIEKKL